MKAGTQRGGDVALHAVEALRAPPHGAPSPPWSRTKDDPLIVVIWSTSSGIFRGRKHTTDILHDASVSAILYFFLHSTDRLDSHLLGKKSWNVYNPENIARVRRDEAQAKAQEEEQEHRMQEVDAERRIKILRGEQPSTPPPPPSPQSTTQPDKKSHREEGAPNRKRRRLAGEDDTDRDIRLARGVAQFADGKRAEVARSHARKSDAPLEDRAGHINLFPSEAARTAPVEKNAEAEAEAATMKRKYEDQHTMRFSNAGEFNKSVSQNPWYSCSGRDVTAPEAIPGKDVWGNEDPMRKEREIARMDANDPLAVMKNGVRRLRTVEEERKKWNEERSRELEVLEDADRSRSRHHRRKRSPSVSGDSLEGFRLDASPESRRDHEDRERCSGRHHRRHHTRDRSRDHSRRHYRHRRPHSRSRRHHRDRHDRHDDNRSSRKL